MIALALMLAQVPAPPIPGLKFTTLGVGSDTCASWMAHRSETDPMRATYKTWLLGFLTGANTEYSRYGHQDPILGTNQDEDALVAFVDHLCADNPDLEVRDAAHALWMDLGDRAVSVRPPL